MTAQAEAQCPPPKISDLLQYSSETEEDSDDSDSNDLPEAGDYEIIDLRGKGVLPRARDKAVEVNEVAHVRKRRHFKGYLGD
jgi:hypothetical protein